METGPKFTCNVENFRAHEYFSTYHGTHLSSFTIFWLVSSHFLAILDIFLEKTRISDKLLISTFKPNYLLLSKLSASPHEKQEKLQFTPGATRGQREPKSHHQGLVHVVLSPRTAVVVLGIDGEAEEEDVHHVLEDRQEAVRHQEGKGAHDEERQHPDGVVPLVVEGQHAAERRAGDDEHLRRQTAE